MQKPSNIFILLFDNFDRWEEKETRWNRAGGASMHLEKLLIASSKENITQKTIIYIIVNIELKLL